MTTSTALWYETKRKLSLRTELLCPVTARDVLIEGLWSGISLGTERLVFHGEVPRSEWQRMCCPHQGGTFQFPVKYGYCFVGRIVGGSGPLEGKTVFCLHPHQTHAVVPSDSVYELPEDLPPQRAVLAANMETALNIVWDSGVSAGDRVLVVGAGVVGLLVSHLLNAMPGVEVATSDVDKDKLRHAQRMSLNTCAPEHAPSLCDVAINVSGSADGLRSALAAVAFEGRVVEASWFGARDVTLPLGGAFHSQRLQLVSSQVGHVPPGRRARWPYRRRMEKAIELLRDPVLDFLITHEIDFESAPTELPPLFGDPAALAVTLRYAPATAPNPA